MAEDGTTEGPTWLEDELDTRPTRRRPLLLALAAVPWFAVAGYLVIGGGTATETAAVPTTPTVEGQAPDTAPAATDQPQASPPDEGLAPSAPPDAEPPGGRGTTTGEDPAGTEAALAANDTDGPTVGEATAVALTVARASLPGPGAAPSLEGLEPIDGHYLEHALLHGVELVADDLAVVTFATVLLPVEDDAYGPPLHRRLAVPVHLAAGGVAPAGPPWWVPHEEPAVARLDLEELDDPDLRLAAAEGLAAAGYRDAAVSAVARTPTGAIVAEVTATTPTGADLAGPVWFHDLDGRLVPAGTAPTR